MLNDHRSNITCFHKKINTLPGKHHGAAAAGKKEEERKNLLREKNVGLGEGALLKDGKNVSSSERAEGNCMHRSATYGVRDV